MSSTFLEQRIHPTVIIGAYTKALDDMLQYMSTISVPINTSNRDEMLRILSSCIGTKIMNKWSVAARVRRC